MNQQINYDFNEYQRAFNKIAREILFESRQEKETEGTYSDDEEIQEACEKMDESEVTYQKIKRILNTPEMIKSHAYLYSLNMENVDECDKLKIDKLYKLGQARGVIPPDDDEEEKTEEPEDGYDELGGYCDDEICGGPDDFLQKTELDTVGDTGEEKCSYTVLYSAMKNGKMKTGEYYSTANSQEEAKRECENSLAPFGYGDIKVLGIEKSGETCGDSSIEGLFEDDSEDVPEPKGEKKDSEPEKEEKNKESEPEKEEEPEPKADDSEEYEKQETGDASESEEKPESETDAGNDEEKTEKKEPPKEEPSEKEGKSELTPAQKQNLKDEYVGLFKSVLHDGNLEKSVSEMSIKEKSDFWATMAEKWTREEPSEFMSKNDIKDLEDLVVKTK